MGSSGYPIVNELSRSPDGKVYAVVSQNDERSNGVNDGRAESLGQLDLSNGHVSITAAPPNATTIGVGPSFRALVFTDNTNFYTFHIDGGIYEKPWGTLLALTPTSNYFSTGSLPAGANANWGVLTGLAMDPDDGSIYGVDGWQVSSDLTAYTTISSTLYLVTYQTPDLPQQPIGSTGYSGIIGLAFGPKSLAKMSPAVALCISGIICPTPTP